MTLSLMIEAVSIALLLAEDMLSRATSVIGAAFAFLGHVLLYHEARLLGPSWLEGNVEDAGLAAGCDVSVLAGGRVSGGGGGGDSFCRLGVRSAGAMGICGHGFGMSVGC